MAKRVRIGDVIEIPTAKGLAYAQLSHNVKRWGSLLRILPGFHPARPEDFSSLVGQEERFVVFFPLQAAVNRNIFEVVGNEEIPQRARPLPLFRAPGFIDREGRVHNWWLREEGKPDRNLGKLDDETRKLPMLEVWNDTLLIQRIEEGWAPATDPRSQG